MKKLLSVLCILLCATLITFTGCSKDKNYALKTFSAETKIANFNIDVNDRQIYICASDDDNTHVSYYDSDNQIIELNANNDTLDLKLNYNNKWGNFIGAKSNLDYRKIIIKIPCFINNLNVSTSNEKVYIDTVSIANNIEINNNGGNIEFKNINVENNVLLNVKNGNIEGSIIGGWDDFSIKCIIKKGKCNLPLEKNQGEKSLSVKCNNGNTNIQFVN